MTNSRLTDPEVLEWRFPVSWKVLAFALTVVVMGIIMAATVSSVAYVSLEPMTAADSFRASVVAAFGLQVVKQLLWGAEFG